jgi:hypothetical protein
MRTRARGRARAGSVLFNEDEVKHAGQKQYYLARPIHPSLVVYVLVLLILTTNQRAHSTHEPHW